MVGGEGKGGGGEPSVSARGEGGCGEERRMEKKRVVEREKGGVLAPSVSARGERGVVRRGGRRRNGW